MRFEAGHLLNLVSKGLHEFHLVADLAELADEVGEDLVRELWTDESLDHLKFDDAVPRRRDVS